MVPGNLKIAVLVCSCQIGDEVITCIPNGTKIVVLVNGWIDIQKNKLGMQRVIQKECWKMMRPGIPIHKIIWVVL
jgi:hypothetical protein